MPVAPPKKGLKATVHKVFILDAQGGYAGEYTPDDSCVVEFSEFLAAMPEAGLADGQTIFLGEWKATAVHGERMSLVCLSKGQLGPEEVGWAKSALVAAEATLVAEPDERTPTIPPGPDRGVMESLSRAITEREEDLARREAAVREMEARTKTAVEEFRAEQEAQVADLRNQLAAANAQHEQDVKALAAEREALRKELDAIAKAPRPGPAPQADPRLDAMRKQNEADRKYLQKYALDLIAREETLRGREGKVEEEGAKLAATRQEIETLRAEVQAAKASPPAAEWEAEKRELEARIKTLEQKSLELLAKEEKIREREQKLLEMIKGIRV